MPHVRRGLLTVVVALAALAVAGPAWAHVDAPTTSAPVLAVFGPEALTTAMPASPGPWLLAAGLAVTLALTLRRRRALVLALLVLLTFGVFEAGLHSVHHLKEADAAKCAVAAVSSHAGGLVVATTAVERPADVVTRAAPAHALTLATSRPSAPDLGRAPPAA
jgi:hypothetical protein